MLTEAKLRKEFLGGIANDEKKAVAAFIKGSSEDALKTKPKVCIEISVLYVFITIHFARWFCQTMYRNSMQYWL